MMKLLITLSIVSVLGSVLGDSVVRDELENCKTEVGAKDNDVLEARQNLSASTKEGKCLRACYMKKIGVIDSEGKHVNSVVVMHLEKFTKGNVEKKKILHEIIDQCDAFPVAKDDCDADYQYGRCIRTQTKERGLGEF